MRNKTIGTVVILLIASATPASASVLDPMSFTTHLCVANCSDPASGTTTTGSLPNSPNASVTLGSSGAQVAGSPSPDPSVLAAANAVGVGTDVRANVLYQYSFEVFGPAGIVPVTVKTSISVGGTSVGGGAWSSFAELSIGGNSISATADSVNNITPTTINLDKTLSLSADKVYLVNLYADAHAQSFFLGDASNGVFAAIDPTLTAPDGYSILLSDGISNDVPEPATWAMMILGFAGIGFMAYRRKSKPTMMAA